ncbi:hypothetical protein M514_04291 [Trichuris suis]|uniref:Uncharacterized protein n=1 Tax=Trichuris suis TaxID=68888 RepID=A0A085NQI2_9BILA|nr:hypothetical protein M513_04291 [Trichuris suis]KFD71728.1 hypothetical protein M514_04291 [Trichuris suis]
MAGAPSSSRLAADLRKYFKLNDQPQEASIIRLSPALQWSALMIEKNIVALRASFHQIARARLNDCFRSACL